MPFPLISVHLHALREQMQHGRWHEALAQVAAMGYAGVETAGFHGLTPAAFAAAVRDLGMVVSANHGACPTPATLAECIDVHHALGTRHAVCGFWREDYRSIDAISRTAGRLATVIPPLAAAGITLLVHNHWYECRMIAGRPAYEHLIERCPGVRFAFDAYWAADSGASDPARLVAGFARRIPVLQLKDGPLRRDLPQAALGRGALDIPAIMAAWEPAAGSWAAVDLGACTDMPNAIADSYEYLVGNHLAGGRAHAPPFRDGQRG